MSGVPFIISALVILTLPGAALGEVLDLADLPYQVGGQVFDYVEEPVAGAVVRLTDQGTGDIYEAVTDASGWFGNTIFTGTPTIQPAQFLGPNHPNPFEGTTTIAVATDGAKDFGGAGRDLEVFDIRGRRVGQIPARDGVHELKNSDLPYGVYFYRLGKAVRKMTGRPHRIVVEKMVPVRHAKATASFDLTLSHQHQHSYAEPVDLSDTSTNLFRIAMETNACGKCQGLVPFLYGLMEKYNYYEIFEIEYLFTFGCVEYGDFPEARQYCGDMIAAYHDDLANFLFQGFPAEAICIVSGQCAP